MPACNQHIPSSPQYAPSQTDRVPVRIGNRLRLSGLKLPGSWVFSLITMERLDAKTHATPCLYITLVSHTRSCKVRFSLSTPIMIEVTSIRTVFKYGIPLV